MPDPVTQVFQGGSGAKNGQTIAILRNRAVWTWGNNDRGQLGIGSRTDSDVPVQVHVPEDVVFVSVSSGGYATYAIDQTGRLWAWGDNRSGQLGTGSGTELATLPVEGRPASHPGVVDGTERRWFRSAPLTDDAGGPPTGG